MSEFRFNKQGKNNLLSNIVLFLMLFAGACTTIEVTPEPEPVDISFSFALSNDRSNEAKYYEGLAEQFTEQFPNINVDIDPVSRAAMLPHSEADVFLLETWTFRDMRAANNLLPLDPFIESDEDFDRTDYFPGLMRAANHEGQTWGIPAGVDPYVMYFNKDLFDQKSIQYPNSGWTWDDFLQSAIAIRDPDANIFGYGPAAFGPGAGNADSLFFIYQNGGISLDDLQNPAQVIYDDPLALEALQWYADLYLVHDVAPTTEQAEEAFGRYIEFNIYEGITAGNVGMWIGGFSEHGGRFYYLSEWPMEWGMVTLPQGKEPFSLASYNLFTISSQSKNPDAAWKWVVFLSEQIPLRLMPARMSVAESERFENQIGKEIKAAAFESIEGANFLSALMSEQILDEWGTYFDAVGRIVNDNLSPSEAMEWAERETRFGTAQIGSPAQPDEEAANPWQVVHQIKIPHTTTYAGFLDDFHGITIGAGGEVHYTTDGGNTWPEAINSSLCRFGLEIVDEQIAWHCGNGGHVRRSKDGGRTWQEVSDFGPNEPRHCRFISFLDAKTGWAATPDQLGMTKNGGTTWQDVLLPEDINNIAAIDLRTPDDGYILGNDGNLYATQDAGQSWTAISLGLDEGKDFIDFDAPMAAMRFFDPDHGLVVVSLMNDGGSEILALRTNDGGKTWEYTGIPAKFGAPFLSRDGSFLTITHLGGLITVLREEGNH